jgi:ribonuclease BN (tRNA processing enzyme)
MQYDIDPMVRSLARGISVARSRLQRPTFFTRPKTVGVCELVVLRRWNSHTPTIYDGVGGGYLLRWNEKGVVIDPGCTFLRVFLGYASVRSYCLEDIDLVVATHDHVDHCEDLGMLLTLFRAYNKKYLEPLKKARKEVYVPRKLDLVLSHGVYFRAQTILEHPKNRNFLRMCKVLPRREVNEPDDGLDLSSYDLRLECLRTRHKELLGDHTGFGLKLTLDPSGAVPFSICDSGDTSYDPTLAAQYRDAGILLLHVGTLENYPNPGDERGEHLGLSGVLKVLSDLVKKGWHEKLKLVLLGEWGQEFRTPGYRWEFTRLVRKYCPELGERILPSDLGMRISLPDCRVLLSGRDGAANADWIDPAIVKVTDRGETLEYSF